MLQALADDHPDISPTRLAEIMSAYPDHAKPSGALALSRDAAFRMPTLWIADAHARHSPTWLYRFDHATPMLKAARIGAGHATELPYVFGNFGTLNVDPTFWLGGRKAAMEVAGRMQRRWLAFARHAVPAALDGSKHWPPYDEESRSTLLIDSPDSLVHDADEVLRIAWGNEVMGFK
jgi:para-nitrobenzyl esterase